MTISDHFIYKDKKKVMCEMCLTVEVSFKTFLRKRFDLLPDCSLPLIFAFQISFQSNPT